jgi:segregation and condensation protein B
MNSAGSVTEAKPLTPTGKAVEGGVEAVLLTADRPVSAARLGEALGLGADEQGKGKKPGAVQQAVDSLNKTYEATGRSFRIESVAGGYRVMTLPEHARVLAAFHGGRATSRLSRAAVETLAIIAYKQPITRATLESVRGVACGEVLRSLLERRLVTITGRAEELGRPILYGTSREFLDVFGLASLKDLPSVAEFQGQA